MTMQGKRLPDVQYGELPDPWPVRGDYWKELDEDGSLAEWWIVAPSDVHAAPGRISLHTVVEHEDGTISVTPSISVQFGDSKGGYHGYLTNGVWSDNQP